jgi:hypothetical protein
VDKRNSFIEPSYFPPHLHTFQLYGEPGVRMVGVSPFSQVKTVRCRLKGEVFSLLFLPSTCQLGKTVG